MGGGGKGGGSAAPAQEQPSDDGGQASAMVQLALAEQAANQQAEMRNNDANLRSMNPEQPSMEQGLRPPQEQEQQQDLGEQFDPNTQLAALIDALRNGGTA